MEGTGNGVAVFMNINIHIHCAFSAANKKEESVPIWQMNKMLKKGRKKATKNYSVLCVYICKE